MTAVRNMLGSLAAAAVCGLGVAGPAHAQADFPNKPIRLIIPFPPGGGTDFVSRIVATKLSETTGWSVVPDNRPGAGGNLAIEAASKSPADGYTIVMGQTDNVMLGPWLYPKVGYDTVKSFVPIVQVSSTPAAIVSGPQSNIRSPADLIARGRSGQGITWATAGNGTVGHVFGEQLRAAAGLNILQIHYKGAAPALADLMGGQVDVAILSLASVISLVRSGKVIGVGVTTAQRAPAAPNIATFEEGALKGTDISIWLGLFAPAGTPAPIVARLNAEVNKALQAADVREKITAQGVSVVGGTSEAFARFVQTDYARWGRMVKDGNVKLD